MLCIIYIVLIFRFTVKKSVLYFTEIICANMDLGKVLINQHLNIGSWSVIVISAFFEMRCIIFYLYIHTNGVFHVVLYQNSNIIT